MSNDKDKGGKPPIEIKKGPEFKPGNKPYTAFGNEMLNANVAWDELVRELMDAGKTKQEIADYAECPVNIIYKIMNRDFEGLFFRAGARIITMHSRAYPTKYAG